MRRGAIIILTGVIIWLSSSLMLLTVLASKYGFISLLEMSYAEIPWPDIFMMAGPLATLLMWPMWILFSFAQELIDRSGSNVQV